MPEIKEVIRRLYLTREEITERFPHLTLFGVSDRFMVEEVYRPAQELESVDALFRDRPADQAWPDFPGTRLVLRGTRFASGRWLSQPQPQQAQDAEHPAPACE